MKTLTPIAILVAFAAACGPEDATNNTTDTNNIRTVDDRNNVSPNNGSSNNGSSNNATSTNSASSNNASSNNASSNNTTSTNSGSNNTSTNNGGGAVTETEPNDDRDGANVVVLGDTISGTAEPGSEDVFVFTGTAGTILELEILSAEPTLDVSLFVEDASNDIEDRVIDLVAGSKRQFFLPEADSWYISMRSFELEERDYEFVIREVTPTPMANAFSGTVAGDLDDRAVDVYELPDANGRVDASLEAERLANGSELDSVMYVYNATDGLVTFNDDATTTTDSELDFMAVTGETYWLVVDAWRLGTTNPYELSVTLP